MRQEKKVSKKSNLTRLHVRHKYDGALSTRIYEPWRSRGTLEMLLIVDSNENIYRAFEIDILMWTVK